MKIVERLEASCRRVKPAQVGSVFCALFVAVCSPIHGQPSTNISRIGALHLGTSKIASFSIEPFKRGLRELGYVEGKNLVVDYRFAEGKQESYTSLATELVALKPAVIVAWGTDVAAAVKKTTTTILIVFCSRGQAGHFGSRC